MLKNMGIERIAKGWLGDPQVQEEAPQQAVFADSDLMQKPSEVAHSTAWQSVVGKPA